MDCFILDYNTEAINSVALEDSIMQKDKPVTAGSKILENFNSPFNATVINKLTNDKYTIAGKTTMDEFGIPGLFSKEPDQVAGAIKAVVDGAATFSLCNDVFGTYRRQAAQNNCAYIHPTYGTVSRYGLISLVSSMDQIGVVCKSLSEGFELLSQIAGNDKNDGAMFPENAYAYKKSDKVITVAIPDFIDQADKNVQEAIAEFSSNFTSTNITLPNFDIYKQVMYILSCAEISNNISRYDGINFGHRTSDFTNLDELYVNSRTEGLGSYTKLAAIMGSMVLSQDQYTPCYEKAMKIRRLIKDYLSFDNYDIIVLPCKISEEPYENLSLYSIANLAGLPSVSFSYKGQGIQLIANVKNESSLLTAWEVCTK